MGVTSISLAHRFMRFSRCRSAMSPAVHRHYRLQPAAKYALAAGTRFCSRPRSDEYGLILKTVVGLPGRRSPSKSKKVYLLVRWTLLCVSRVLQSATEIPDRRLASSVTVSLKMLARRLWAGFVSSRKV